MKQVLVLLFTFLVVNSSAQNSEWVKEFGYSGSHEYAGAVVSDGNGYVYVTGSTGSYLNEKVFLTKYDTVGNIIWLQTSTANDKAYGTGISTDKNGNIYVGGYFYCDSIKFGGITLHNQDKSGGPHPDFFIVKYTPSGSVLWAKQFGSRYSDRLHSLSTDENGNILITGYFDSDSINFGNGIVLFPPGSSYNNPFSAKFDSSGNAIWAKGNSGTYEQAEVCGIASDPAGNVYVLGFYSSNTLTFGSTVLYNSNTNQSKDMFIIKYDSAGNLIWAKGFGGVGDDYGYYISTQLGIDNNIYVMGSYSSPDILFGTTTLSNYDVSGTTSDVFILKLNSAGDIIFAKGIGGTGNDYAGDIYAQSNGSFFVTGQFISPAQFGGSHTLTYGNIFYGQYDQYGNPLWINCSGQSASDYAAGISSDISGYMYLSGSFSSPSISFFDGMGYNNATNSNASSPFYDAYLTKITSPNDVWPGDANHDFIADNNDLLSIGLYYSQTGTSRVSVSNSWKANSSVSWGRVQNNGSDMKHADCNGDGIVNSSDTLAIKLNMNLKHAITPQPYTYEHRNTEPKMYFVIDNKIYQSGDWINAELWLGTSTTPITDLYGIAFDIKYDPSLIKAGSESITYPNSWLGIKGTNAITISKINASSNIACGAKTRIDHNNASGYGKIATFNFQLNNNITLLDTIKLDVIRYTAVKADGGRQIFNVTPIIVPLAVAINEHENMDRINIYPNPSSDNMYISYSLNKKSNVDLEIYNSLGQKIETLVNEYQSPGNYKYNFSVNEKGSGAGIYFIKITVNDKSTIKKIVRTK